MHKKIGLIVILLLILLAIATGFKEYRRWQLIKPPKHTSIYKAVPNTSDTPPSPAIQKQLEAARPIMQQAREAPDRQSVLAYNQAFAKRFGLDESKAQELGEGLYAIELVVKKLKRADVLGLDYPEIFTRQLPDAAHLLIDKNGAAIDAVAPHAKSQMRFMFECYLNVYVDSHLKIQYPYESQLSSRKTARDLHSLARRFIEDNTDKPGFKINKEDSKYAYFRDRNKNSFESKAFIGNRLTQEHGFREAKTIYYNTDMQYYKKNWQPGINYLALKSVMGCVPLATMEPAAYLLLEKEGHPYYGRDDYPGDGYFELSYVDPDDFYAYPLPKSLLESAPLQLALKRELNTWILDLKHFTFYPNNQ